MPWDMWEWLADRIWEMFWWGVGWFMEFIYAVMNQVIGELDWLPPIELTEEIRKHAEIVNDWLPLDTVVALIPAYLAFEGSLWVWKTARTFFAGV